MKSLRWKLFVVLAVLIGAGFLVYPTIVYYTKYHNLSPEEKAKVPKSRLESLKKKALNLGLDLQGGMYIILEVDRSKLSPEEAKDAPDRALEVIRNRIDQWGVSEPSLQKIGGDKIMIQLPGVMDRERARSLIGRTAMLEFKLLADEKMAVELLERIDKRTSLGATGAIPVETTAISQTPETTSHEKPETTAQAPPVDTALATTGAFLSMVSALGNDMAVLEDNVDSVNRVLARDDIKAIIPSGYTFVWGKTEEGGANKFRRLYLVKAEPEITGAYVTDSKVTVGGSNDPQTANKPVVILGFNRQGAARFAQITGRNVGKRLAIILDGTVYSAPVIRERISGGSAQITGMESMDEAKELSVVLKAGALPAPVNIVEERSVGPTLGGDS
ncbi:MAG: preprotein translocase subunit SecD, partial [Candidatus Hydrothermia bacterium]